VALAQIQAIVQDALTSGATVAVAVTATTDVLTITYTVPSRTSAQRVDERNSYLNFSGIVAT
jgi:hypothetical protein